MANKRCSDCKREINGLSFSVDEFEICPKCFHAFSASRRTLRVYATDLRNRCFICGSKTNGTNICKDCNED